MSESRAPQISLPAGSIPVGTAAMRDGRPVLLVLLPTGVIIPLIKR